MQLCQSEWTVLQSLWERQPQTLMQLVEDLKVRAGWSASTSKTMAARMSGKGPAPLRGQAPALLPERHARGSRAARRPSSCSPARSAAGSVCSSAILPITERSERTSWTSSTPFWTRPRAAANRKGERRYDWKSSFHPPFSSLRWPRCGCSCAGRLDPRLQYALWLLAALRLLLPVPLVSSPVSVMNAAADVPAAVQRLTAPEDRRAPQPDGTQAAAAAASAAVAEPQAQTKEKLPVRTILKTRLARPGRQ